MVLFMDYINLTIFISNIDLLTSEVNVMRMGISAQVVITALTRPLNYVWLIHVFVLPSFPKVKGQGTVKA